MDLKKFRWSQVYESSEEELIDILEARNIDSKRIHGEFGEAVTQQHDQNTTIWCAEGSFKIKVGSTSMSLQPGDALRIEANTAYIVQPGIANCAYYLSA